MICPWCTNDEKRLQEIILENPTRILCVVCSKVFTKEKEHAEKEWPKQDKRNSKT